MLLGLVGNVWSVSTINLVYEEEKLSFRCLEWVGTGAFENSVLQPRPTTDGYAPCAERLARNARTYRLTLANGAFQFFTTSDPGRLLLTGQPADLGVVDPTQSYLYS